MPDDTNEMGPISYLIVEFPGNKMTGEGLDVLVDLVDRGVVRVLDLLFVTRDEDGSMRGDRAAGHRQRRRARPRHVRGRVVRPPRRLRPRRRGVGDRAGLVGRRPDLREPLGDAVHAGAAPRRRGAGRGRLHPARRDRGSLDATES